MRIRGLAGLAHHLQLADPAWYPSGRKNNGYTPGSKPSTTVHLSQHESCFLPTAFVIINGCRTLLERPPEADAGVPLAAAPHVEVSPAVRWAHRRSPIADRVGGLRRASARASTPSDPEVDLRSYTSVTHQIPLPLNGLNSCPAAKSQVSGTVNSGQRLQNALGKSMANSPAVCRALSLALTLQLPVEHLPRRR